MTDNLDDKMYDANQRTKSNHFIKFRKKTNAEAVLRRYYNSCEDSLSPELENFIQFPLHYMSPEKIFE